MADSAAFETAKGTATRPFRGSTRYALAPLCAATADMQAAAPLAHHATGGATRGQPSHPENGRFSVVPAAWPNVAATGPCKGGVGSPRLANANGLTTDGKIRNHCMIRFYGLSRFAMTDRLPARTSVKDGWTPRWPCLPRTAALRGFETWKRCGFRIPCPPINDARRTETALVAVTRETRTA